MSLPLASRISKKQVQTDQLLHSLYTRCSLRLTSSYCSCLFTIYVQHSRALMRKSTEKALNTHFQNTNAKLAHITGTDIFQNVYLL